MAAILERDLGDSGAGMSDCTEGNGQLLGGGYDRRIPFTHGYMDMQEFWIVFLVLFCVVLFFSAFLFCFLLWSFSFTMFAS